MIHRVVAGETIAIIARNYRRTIQQLLQANPTISNANLIYPGQEIIIPGLAEPNMIPYLVKVSLRNRQLTLFHNGKKIKTYPVAIGKMLTNTPTGQYVVVNREPNPGGPFGAMWLSLSRAGYGIHGTNDPSSIGKAVSHGCIRMHNRDVLELAYQIPNGTKVYIQP